ncbi:unnamed protein product [Trichobilharzia regenti]|nr:unnamed protein product [Trichobilharzia regenti]
MFIKSNNEKFCDSHSVDSSVLESIAGGLNLELKSIEKIIFLANTANCPVVISSPNGLKTIEEVSEARRQIPPAHMTVCCTPNSLQPTTTKGQQYANKFLSRLTNGDITLISSDHYGVNSSDTIGKRLTTIWEVGVVSSSHCNKFEFFFKKHANFIMS